MIMISRLKVMRCLAAALAISLLAKASLAQQAVPSAQSNDTLEEVVITARGRSEQLLDVPISDTAFSASQLQSANVREVGDFINLTPNITIVQAQDSGYSAITIRGITQVRNSESPVAVVVDGVDEVVSNQFTQELFDLQSIEVARGPQGALYGRDAEGGAILITTKQPTNAVEGYGQVGGGNGTEYNAQGVISGPIVTNQLFARFGVSYVDRDGYFENDYLDRPQDPFRDVTVQGLLKWVPSDTFTADLKASYSNTDGGALNYHFQGDNLLPNGLINPANPVNFFIPGNANLVSDTFISRDIGQDKRTLDDVSLKLNYELGFAALSSISAYNRVNEGYVGDGYPYGNTDSIPYYYGTFGPYCCVDESASQYYNTNSVSEEIRLTSPTNQAFRWMIGGYYLYRDSYLSTTTGTNNGLGLLQIERIPAGPATINPTASFIGADNRDTDPAVFANVDYDLVKQVTLSAAFRYDQDQVTQHVSGYNTIGTPGAINKTTYDKLQPKFTATYKPLSNLSFYASWGVGFRSGEFNPSDAALLAGGVPNKVPEETAQTSEIGFKSSWLDNRFNITGDYYYTDVTNQQYFVFLGSVAAQVLVPINDVHLSGGELELSALLAPGLEAYGSLGVTKSTIESYALGSAIDGKSDVGNWAPYVPDMTANAGMQYRAPITANLVFFTRGDYRLLGKQYWDTANTTARNPVNLIALSLGLEDAKGKWNVSVKADNLFDKKYNAEYVAGGYVEPALPRVIRGTLRYNF